MSTISAIIIDLENEIKRVREMKIEGKDRLGVVSRIKNLAVIVAGLSAGWVRILESPRIDELSHEYLENIFDFFRRTALEILEDTVEMNEILAKKKKTKREVDYAR